MRSLYFCLAALAMTAPAYTQTTPPAAPSVTAGPEFKGLRFDWDPVQGASWYQLEYRAHQTGPFVQLGSNYPATVTRTAFRLPLHLYDWTYARYRLAACNSAGCTRSSEVPVADFRRDAVGYFKAAQSLIGISLGSDTDISPDGLHFVAAAPGDFINNGAGAMNGGAFYVFRRASNGTWTQRARLTPPIQPSEQGGFTAHVAISADGNTVVAGMPDFASQDFDEQNGEAFVFHFNGTTWTRTKLASGSRGNYGRWVGLNDAGDTIAVASGDNISAATPNRIFIYRLANGAWTPVRTLSYRAGEFCHFGAFSRDGTTVAEQCSSGPNSVRFYARITSGPNWTVREELPLKMNVSSDNGFGNSGIGISADGNTVAAQIHKLYGPDPNMGPAEVHVFHRDGAWSKVATLTPGAWRVDAQKNFYGLSIAVSGDGSTIAVGDSWDNGFGTGPRAAPLNPDPNHRSGAIYVYRFKTNWVLANMVKPNLAFTSPSSFGHDVSLNGNGQTLIVGFPSDGSDADGIGGDWNNYNGNGGGSGAVFMY